MVGNGKIEIKFRGGGGLIWWQTVAIRYSTYGNPAVGRILY